MSPVPAFAAADALCVYLAAQRNDLEAPAIDLCPGIAEARAALAARPGCRLARMSGSGATCFGLFAAEPAALAAAGAIRRARPAWWVAAAPVG
jgi:4-diphosphocytidyl-2-C-methyl-D-erythritol kinase